MPSSYNFKNKTRENSLLIFHSNTIMYRTHTREGRKLKGNLSLRCEFDPRDPICVGHVHSFLRFGKSHKERMHAIFIPDGVNDYQPRNFADKTS